MSNYKQDMYRNKMAITRKFSLHFGSTGINGGARDVKFDMR